MSTNFTTERHNIIMHLDHNGSFSLIATRYFDSIYTNFSNDDTPVEFFDWYDNFINGSSRNLYSLWNHYEEQRDDGDEHEEVLEYVLEMCADLEPDDDMVFVEQLAPPPMYSEIPPPSYTQLPGYPVDFLPPPYTA